MSRILNPAVLGAVLGAALLLALLARAPVDVRAAEGGPPRVAVPDAPLDGTLRLTRPRILMPDLFDGWTGTGPPPGMARRLAAYRAQGVRLPGNPCRTDEVGPLTVCWLLGGDGAAGRRAIQRLVAEPVITTQVSGTYGDSWLRALAYDLLQAHPAWTGKTRAVVATKLARELARHLMILEHEPVSLWHGRATLAAQAWILAVALGGEGANRREQIRRAQHHFLDTVAALALTEGWPEGYNYWINNRALVLGLAAAAYVNGLVGAEHGQRVAAAVRRAGLWTLYATRPDNRIEGLGDEGPRVDLKDETRRAIDVFAQVSRDPVLAAYSRYLGRLYGAYSYYRLYAWQFALANDPTVLPAATMTRRSLAPLDGVVPTADLFGRGALNQVFMRSDWDTDATFISFRAGKTFTHHGHADAGHFTLFKGAPLAVNSSLYGRIDSPNRLYYAGRTVAKNALLVLRPGEHVRPNDLFAKNVAPGGQRLPLPTGSSIESVAHWRANLAAGLHLDGGRILHFAHAEGDYTFVAADLTAAYDTPAHDAAGEGGKVTRVRRALFYDRAADALWISDEVVATAPAFVKKWLLHTVARPNVEGARVLRGDAGDGILETAADRAEVANGRGRLVVRRLLPADGVLRLVGGPHHRYYVEADGDDGDLDGFDAAEGANPRPWFDAAAWRLELQPAAPRRRDRFLVALLPSLDAERADAVRLVDSPDASLSAGILGDRLVVFLHDSAPRRLDLTLPAAVRHLALVGLDGDAVLDTGAGPRPLAARDGVATADLDLAGGNTVALILH